MMKRTILVVDDEKDIVESARNFLQRQGYDVWAAYDGWQAMQLAGQQPDLILLDIVLPDIDGVEVLRQLKRSAETAHLPVIMISAQGASRYIFETQELLATDYLIKPFELKELLSVIKRYIP